MKTLEEREKEFYVILHRTKCFDEMADKLWQWFKLQMEEDREEIMMGVSHEAGFVGLGGMFVNSPISKLEIKTGKVTEPTSYELGKLIYQEIKFTLKNSKESK